MGADKEADAKSAKSTQLSKAKNKLAEVKAECEAEAEEKVNAAKAVVDRELKQALAVIEAKKQGAMGDLESSVTTLATSVVDRVWISDATLTELGATSEEISAINKAVKEADGSVKVPSAV